MKLIYEVKEGDKWVAHELLRKTPARVYFWDDLDNEEFYLSKDSKGDKWRTSQVTDVADGFFPTQCPGCNLYDRGGTITQVPRDMVAGDVVMGFCYADPDDPVPLMGEGQGACPGYLP